ncbi:AhpC/TSA family protein [Maribacter algarum]|uniref:AhpC/TSA family protein n=1 Tax=Maribacter algarum (ex Zhang et al. 2020) TaxID=2578118 RepID=A0A5S3PYU7_9FLAO|nr:TlpA disulfide reductase family protein [Maribacter algarum]TMM58487.1 AhpC/TSA family protein [Maribacter algarum]
MRKTFFIITFLITFSIKGQHLISGTFSPAKEYSWIIAYHLKPGTQVYVADTAIKNGEFSLKLPEKSTEGTYRLVYAVPQEEFYFDVIYNGNEDIKLTFDSTQGLTFTESKENILFGTYFNEMNVLEREMISFYSNGSTDVNTYQELLKKYQKVQESYEKKSEELTANQFIKANKPYIPTEYEPIQDYVRNRKKSYFENLDLTNSTLQASGFLTDKLANYVFTALPLDQLEKAETEKEIQANITTIYEKLKGVSDTYAFHVLYTLWTQSSGSDFNDTSDFIYNTYLKPSKVASANKDIIDKIEIYNRLRIGVVPPEISWKNGDTQEKLSTLKSSKNYLLVFWSSTCGHCLKELPALHEELKENKNVKVIAVGLEDDEVSWNIESSKLENFEHAIALGKWDSEYAQLYDIHATPTYFILDENKKIIAKPDTDREVISFLREN